jgi:hypothetical protein
MLYSVISLWLNSRNKFFSPINGCHRNTIEKLEAYLRIIQGSAQKGKLCYLVIYWDQFQSSLPMILVTEDIYNQLSRIYFNHYTLKCLRLFLGHLKPVLHKDFHTTAITSQEEFCNLLDDYKKDNNLWSDMQFSDNAGLMDCAATLLNTEIQESQNQ